MILFFVLVVSSAFSFQCVGGTVGIYDTVRTSVEQQSRRRTAAHVVQNLIQSKKKY